MSFKKTGQKFINMIKVGVIIVTFNNEKDIQDCLEGLKDVDIIVVDNNSSDKTVEILKRVQDDRIKIIESKENLGLSKANNLAIREFLQNGMDYVLILNPDTLVSPSLISDLVETMQKNPEVGICGSKIYFAPGFEFHKDRYKKDELGKVFWFAGGVIDWKNVLISHFGVDEVDKGQYESVRNTDFVTGCAMFVRKSVFEKVGLISDEFAMYLEDLDLSLRAKKAGFKVVYAPVSAVWHKNAQSSGVGSFTQDYYVARNRLLFAVKYANTRAKLAVIRESWKLLFKGRSGQKKGIKDFYAKKFGVMK